MDKIAALTSSSLFDMLSTEELEYVADLSRPRRFSAGEHIIEEGDLGDSLFVVFKGEVDILRKDASGTLKMLATLAPGQFFGEMSLIDKDVRSATARARSECELLHLTAENLTSFRKNHRDGFTFVIINIARVLSNRLRDANNRLASRL